MILFEHRGEPDPQNSRQRKPGQTRGRKKGSTPWNKGMKNGKKRGLWSRVKRFVGIKDSDNSFDELMYNSQLEFDELFQSKAGKIKKASSAVKQTSKKVGKFINKNSGAIIATAAVGNFGLAASGKTAPKTTTKTSG